MPSTTNKRCCHGAGPKHNAGASLYDAHMYWSRVPLPLPIFSLLLLIMFIVLVKLIRSHSFKEGKCKKENRIIK